MDNIPVLVGSGVRRVNTDQRADAFIEGAALAGHQVTKVFLGDKSINGCIGCNACKKDNTYVIEDDMHDIYPLFDRCDTVVLARPCIFGQFQPLLRFLLKGYTQDGHGTA